MLSVERQEFILGQLARHGVVRVESLAEQTEVSGETIRKDLIELEQAGRLRRTRGGATRQSVNRLDLPLPEREPLNRGEKALIAREACGLLQPRETVFLDASSTVLTMTDYFPSMEVTVLTNASHVIVSLGERDGVDLICTGGDYERRSRSYVGIVAEEAVRRYYLNWLFIGVNGLDSERGASEVNPGQARLKEQILRMAEQVVVLADSSKLECKSPFFFARPEQIDLLITDAGADAAVLDRYRERGITVRVAGERSGVDKGVK